ncbi:proline-rich protein 2-like [Phyllopteryx taeniolatus]|uniref:proline-rich protein 2-like n=1 Tax=Phyllopteryx taeniolatus TaxID=161469 RepID=UPI002AD2D8A8|nr:proline-rich protein 2-like [Phyllopteryx taeniolatus]
MREQPGGRDTSPTEGPRVVRPGQWPPSGDCRDAMPPPQATSPPHPPLHTPRHATPPPLHLQESKTPPQHADPAMQPVPAQHEGGKVSLDCWKGGQIGAPDMGTIRGGGGTKDQPRAMRGQPQHQAVIQPGGPSLRSTAMQLSQCFAHQLLLIPLADLFDVCCSVHQ